MYPGPRSVLSCTQQAKLSSEHTAALQPEVSDSRRTASVLSLNCERGIPHRPDKSRSWCQCGLCQPCNALLQHFERPCQANYQLPGRSWRQDPVVAPARECPRYFWHVLQDEQCCVAISIRSAAEYIHSKILWCLHAVLFVQIHLVVLKWKTSNLHTKLGGCVLPL